MPLQYVQDKNEKLGGRFSVVARIKDARKAALPCGSFYAVTSYAGETPVGNSKRPSAAGAEAPNSLFF